MKKSWSPTHPPSSGAEAYHNAVINTTWHISNILHLIKIITLVNKKDNFIVDFGAGTGSSAFFILRILKNISMLLLVDNSPSWLGNAYKILHSNKKTKFMILDKKEDNSYEALDELTGSNNVDIVICANTVHLIPDINHVFTGICNALKPGGYFAFQSGNIERTKRNKDILLIDSTIGMIHDFAIRIIHTDNTYKAYRKDLKSKIKSSLRQRKFVFPSPRPVDFYKKALIESGFTTPKVTSKKIRVKYKDWMKFVKVKRLQAGILPEIGGVKPTQKEEYDRNSIIEKAAQQYFNHLKANNVHASSQSFKAEWTYYIARKI